MEQLQETLPGSLPSLLWDILCPFFLVGLHQEGTTHKHGALTRPQVDWYFGLSFPNSWTERSRFCFSNS